MLDILFFNHQSGVLNCHYRHTFTNKKHRYRTQPNIASEVQDNKFSPAKVASFLSALLKNGNAASPQHSTLDPNLSIRHFTLYDELTVVVCHPPGPAAEDSCCAMIFRLSATSAKVLLSGHVSDVRNSASENLTILRNILNAVGYAAAVAYYVDRPAFERPVFKRSDYHEVLRRLIFPPAPFKSPPGSTPGSKPGSDRSISGKASPMISKKNAKQLNFNLAASFISFLTAECSVAVAVTYNSALSKSLSVAELQSMSPIVFLSDQGLGIGGQISKVSGNTITNSDGTPAYEEDTDKDQLGSDSDNDVADDDDDDDDSVADADAILSQSSPSSKKSAVDGRLIVGAGKSPSSPRQASLPHSPSNSAETGGNRVLLNQTDIPKSSSRSTGARSKGGVIDWVKNLFTRKGDSAKSNLVAPVIGKSPDSKKKTFGEGHKEIESMTSSLSETRTINVFQKPKTKKLAIQKRGNVLVRFDIIDGGNDADVITDENLQDLIVALMDNLSMKISSIKTKAKNTNYRGALVFGYFEEKTEMGNDNIISKRSFHCRLSGGAPYNTPPSVSDLGLQRVADTISTGQSSTMNGKPYLIKFVSFEDIIVFFKEKTPAIHDASSSTSNYSKFTEIIDKSMIDMSTTIRLLWM